MPTDTRVFQLNYSDIEELRDKVESALSPIGTASFDTRTTQVIVTDQAKILDKIERIVLTFDRPDAEVLIDAKIIKVVLTDDTKLGIDWNRTLGGIDGVLRSNFDTVSGDVATADSVTGGAFSFSYDGFGAVIEALQTIGKTETLSNPRIMVSNEQEAKILVGTREAFVTVTTTTPSSGSVISSPEIEFVDVGTKLFVTPKIKNDGHVELHIRPEVSTASVVTFQENRIPILTTTEAETIVLVKSGMTIMIGGLIDSKEESTVNRVPVLSGLPLVGGLFTGTSNTSNKTELVIFLTPEIVMPDGSPYVPAPSGNISRSISANGSGYSPVSKDYHKKVRDHLQSYVLNAFRSEQFPAGSVELTFTLDSEGWIRGEHKITSKDGFLFEDIAETALGSAMPFPKFPQGTRENELRFRISIDYTPDHFA